MLACEPLAAAFSKARILLKYHAYPVSKSVSLIYWSPLKSEVFFTCFDKVAWVLPQRMKGASLVRLRWVAHRAEFRKVGSFIAR